MLVDFGVAVLTIEQIAMFEDDKPLFWNDIFYIVICNYHITQQSFATFAYSLF
jgi:hypothetical protein